MKRVFILAAIMLSMFAAMGQKTYELDAKKAPKTEIELKQGAEQTKDVAVYKGKKYPVYKTANGKLFIVVQSPTTKNFYRKYFKESQ